MINIIKKESGLSLLEVLISVAILSVGLMAIASMQINTMQGNDRSESITDSLFISQDIAESLIRMDFDDNQLDDTNPANWNGAANDFADLSQPPPAPLVDTDFPSAEVRDMNNPANVINGIQYGVVTYIQDDTPAPNVKTIAVAVTWTDQARRYIIYRTVVGNPIL